MNPAFAPVARKYAAAFLSVAHGTFTAEDFALVDARKELLISSRAILFYLNLPIIKEPLIDRVLDLLFEKVETAALLKKVTRLLMKHHRVIILPEVLHQICDLYKKEKGLMQFTITSAHELDADLQQQLLNYLERETGLKVMPEFAPDRSLIAGVRMQSDTLLWEHSIRKQLRNAQQAIVG
jgi:F-type H+-transporting ATPase subunit delta